MFKKKKDLNSYLKLLERQEKILEEINKKVLEDCRNLKMNV